MLGVFLEECIKCYHFLKSLMAPSDVCLKPNRDVKPVLSSLSEREPVLCLFHHPSQLMS